MGECLVIARKSQTHEPPSGRAIFVSLRAKPRGVSNALDFEMSILASPAIRKLYQSQGGMCIYNTSVIGLGFSQKSFGL